VNHTELEKYREEYEKGNYNADEVYDDAVKYAKLAGTKIVRLVRQIGEILKTAKGRKTIYLILIPALLYLLSPIDTVPDFIPFAGFLDDFAVLTYAIKAASKLIKI